MKEEKEYALDCPKCGSPVAVLSGDLVDDQDFWLAGHWHCENCGEDLLYPDSWDWLILYPEDQDQE